MSIKARGRGPCLGDDPTALVGLAMEAGRAVFDAALGSLVHGDFGIFGEETGNRARARMLDGSLDLAITEAPMGSRAGAAGRRRSQERPDAVDPGSPARRVPPTV